MTKKRVEQAVEALTQHTSETHYLKHQSGFWFVQTKNGDATKTVLCSGKKQGLFNAICYYIQGYHAGRRSV